MTYLELPEDITPHIHVTNVGSDLRLRVWERAAIAAEGDAAELNQEPDGRYVIHAASDLDLKVPAHADVTIDNIGSDAKITGLQGMLTIGSVGSDLALRKTGPVTVSRVGSDLSIRRAAGDIQIGQIGSDATLREIEGQIVIKRVGSDLYVRDLMGPCRVERIGADLLLSTDFVPGGVYSFTVGSDIVCRVPADADVRFRILGCDDLHIDTPDAELIEGETHDEVVFGAGAALVELQAGSEIRFAGQAADYLTAINVQLEEELEARLSGLEEKLSAQLAGLDNLISANAERIRERAEHEATRAIHKTEEALRRVERKDRKAGSKRKRGFVFSFDAGGAAPRPQRPPEPREPVSDDERLMILRMVESGQISVEDAERLLAALEGRS